MTTPAGDSITIKDMVTYLDLPNGSEFFFGFISDVPLTEVTFHTTIADNVEIDAVRSSALPEPSTACLWCGGLLLIRSIDTLMAHPALKKKLER
jgi:hypothetical protein